MKKGNPKSILVTSLIVLILCLPCIFVGYKVGEKIGLQKGQALQLEEQYGWKTYTSKTYRMSFQYPSTLTIYKPDGTMGNEGELFLKSSNLQSPTFELQTSFPDVSNDTLPSCAENDWQAVNKKYPCVNLGVDPGQNNDPIEKKIVNMISNSTAEERCISYGNGPDTDYCYFTVKSPSKNFAIRMSSSPMINCNFKTQQTGKEERELIPFEEIVNSIKIFGN